jgi:hypothetical protein
MNLSPSSSYHHHRHRRRSSRSPRPPERSHGENKQERTDYIIDTFLRNFSDDMRANPKGWRGRFRKMAANNFAFYRGSAVLFYRDMKHDAHHDPWLRNCKEASSVFIHVRQKIFLQNNKSFLFSLG